MRARTEHRETHADRHTHTHTQRERERERERERDATGDVIICPMLMMLCYSNVTDNNNNLFNKYNFRKTDLSCSHLHLLLGPSQRVHGRHWNAM